jgi:hypothetical protein
LGCAYLGNISLETFFGSELENVQKALSMVEKYQRTIKEGRGRITRYLDPWKSTGKWKGQVLQYHFFSPLPLFPYSTALTIVLMTMA